MFRPTSDDLAESTGILEQEIFARTIPDDQTDWAESIQLAISNARHALLELQHPDGYWCFELEADCTIPAEYILMMHFMDEIDEVLQSKLASYIRSKQNEQGGWPLYYRGRFDMSCTVKAYYALKLAGDDADSPHMQRARELILVNGGAAKSNVFTRIALAMFEQVPWRAVPYIPAEIMLFPKWFVFHLEKVSYWTRTVLVPLTILYSAKATAKNPNNVSIRELFITDPFKEKKYFPIRSKTNAIFLLLERSARLCSGLIPGIIHRHAIKRAETWFIERLNGEDGLGAIFPAMVNAHEALAILGYPKQHPLRKQTKQALEKLVVDQGESAYCQPCVSPVWDSALAALALMEGNNDEHRAQIKKSLDWLVSVQITDEAGDWRDRKPHVPGGGWAFQFANPHYPDLDDTAVVAWAMHDFDQELYRTSIQRAAVWIDGMQSRNGGFAAFDADNMHYILNEIPFADHGALLDPPTSDVTARCMTFLSHHDNDAYKKTLEEALSYLQKEQEEYGAWFGRWGTNFIYGTWSVLMAFEKLGISQQHPAIVKAVKWLKSVQRSDGGWGETNDSYEKDVLAGVASRSTTYQTAWALLALMAVGEVESEAVRKGIEYLLRKQSVEGLWNDPEFTAPGFPRVFYLKYHGYDKYFPLWALSRYANLTQAEVVD